MKTLNSFFKDENGASAIEYGLIAALISVSIIVGAKSIGSNLSTIFTNVGTNLSNAAR